MISSRDEASLIGLTLRLREGLRRDLEETAKERGVSLNQQITDCLEHFRDRRGLLPEVLATVFTDKTAAITLMLALVMEDAGYLHLHGTRRRHYIEGIHWIEDGRACAAAFNAAIAVLTAFPSWTRMRRQGKDSIQVAREMVRAVKRSRHRNSQKLSPSIVNDVAALLGPLARELDDPKPATVSPSSPLPPAQAETASKKIADAIMELINSQPRTPSREELAQLVRSHLAKIGA